MRLRQEAPTIDLNEAEVHVALAFLGDNETAKLLTADWTDKAALRNQHRINFLECEPEDTSPRAIYNHIKTYIPELLLYTLSIEHKDPLIEAFGAAISLQQPTRADWLGRISRERAGQLAEKSRDRLSAAGEAVISSGLALGQPLVLVESPQSAS